MLALVVAAVLALPTGAGAMTGPEKKAEKDRIEADYKAARERCEAAKGDDRDVCLQESRGRRKVALAELDAKDKGSGRAQAKARKVKADEDYSAARKRCDARSGEEKRICRRQAKVAHEAAPAQAPGR